MYEDIHPVSSIRSSHSPPLLHHHQQINQIDQLPETESQLHSQSNHIKHQTANNSSIQSNQSNTVASSQTQIVASSTASESPASIQSQTTGKLIKIFIICLPFDTISMRFPLFLEFIYRKIEK